MKLKLSKINQKHNFVITVVEDVREHVLEKLLKQRKFKTMQHLLTLTFLRTKICQIRKDSKISLHMPAKSDMYLTTIT